MKNFEKFKSMISEVTSIAVTLLCLGITVQLIVGEPLFGWNVVGNITKAVGSLGQSNFVGIVALLVLFSIFKNKKSI
jgi:hypothetical protein